MLKRIWATRSVLAVTALTALGALNAGNLALAAAAAAAALEGTTYRLIPSPQPLATAGKIEVTEFFSYACPHCNEFYPLVSAWSAKLPKDVVFSRVPVGFNRPVWVNLARAFYALKASGDFDKLDGALFHALHTEQLNLVDVGSLSEWVGKNGGHADKFANAYTSFGVNNATAQADEAAQNYTVDAVPTLAVNGRYIVLGNSFEEILGNADKVIAMVRGPGKTSATK